MRRLGLAALLLAVGCGKDPSKDGVVTDEDFTEDTPLGPGGTAACGELANLEIVPLDIWGRDLEGTALDTDYDPTTVPDADAGPGVVIIRYGEVPVDLSIRIEADEHEAIKFTAEYDGKGGFDFTEPAEGRLASSSQERTIDGESCPITTVYAGLDHSWFAATGRAPTRNYVELLMDGEDFWNAVADDLVDVEDRVSWSTWWWMSDFELVRSENWSMSESRRWENTVMAYFQELDRVERRVLINRFWDENSDWNEYLNTDSELREAADERGDDFEVVLQGNPTEVPVTGEYEGEAADYDFDARVAENPRYADRGLEPARDPVPVDVAIQAASYHQKFMVFDGEVAFVTGMNTKSTDWDTHEHRVYDAHRMDYDASSSERQAVANEEELPDLGPRKDYGIRVKGPAARDVEEVFHLRWEAALDGNDLYAENASRFDLDEALSEPPDGLPTQIAVTLPEPWAEMSLGESHAKALARATEYIYIEDQYFRAPMMHEHIIEAMDANPDLVLIVVSKDVSDLDGGAKFTYLADATFRQLYPDRYQLIQLVTADLYLEEGSWWDTVELEAQNVDTHSKIRLIDDRYLSVGSCNFNNRGYKYEGEMNVTVLDQAFTTAAREAIFENLVGEDWAELLSDDARNNFDVIAMAAEENAEILEWWEEHADDFDVDEAELNWDAYHPSGFVTPLEIGDGYWWDVGPDAF